MEYFKLEECCEILDSKRIPITEKDRVPGNIPYYGANGIQDYVNDYIFDDELVLLAEDGGNFGSKTRPIAYRVSGKCWVNNHAHVLKPKSIVDVDFLCYSLMFYNVDSIINGATRKKLTQSAMREMKIPKLILNKQLGIVKRLKTIEKIIDHRKQQLEQLDLLTKSRFVEMFGDVNVNEKKWYVKKLNDICSLKSGGTPSRQHPEYFEGTIPWITTVSLGKMIIDERDAVEFITEEAIENSATKLIPKNSLLFGVRVGVGKVSKNIIPMCTNQDIVAITNIDEHTINLIFLKQNLDMFSNLFDNQKRGATIQGIKSDVLKNIEIILPPIELQNEFARFVEQVEKTKTQVQKSLDEAQLLFNSLMQEYFG